MEFKFAKYTEVTKLAKALNSEYESSGYERIFICPDVRDVWLARLLVNFDEDYNYCKGKILLERNKIENNYKNEKLTIKRVKEILKNDSFENWDFYPYENKEDAIFNLDDGFGIINEDNL